MSDDLPELGALEREVMLLVWRHTPVTAEDIRVRLAKPLKDSTVRTVLRRLEDKGYIYHSVEGRSFLFHPVEARTEVAAKAVKRICDWYCGGSVEDVLMGMVQANLLDRTKLDQLMNRLDQPVPGTLN